MQLADDVIALAFEARIEGLEAVKVLGTKE
jgi:hypothetical protein